ncbi:MAG: hypothetical protein ACRD2S_08875, partial [Terriglobales bacterium]
MMRFVLFVLLLATLAVGQENSSTPAAPAPPKVTSSSHTKTAKAGMAANPAVITIKGVCEASAAERTPATKSAGPECKTVVTRAEFEKLVDTLKVPPQAEKQFATQY